MISTHEGLEIEKQSQIIRIALQQICQSDGQLITLQKDGNPYDNAIAERVNGILKDEFALGDKMKDLVELKEKITLAAEIYNNQRPHTSCHLLTPNQMHQQQKLKIVT